MAAENGVNSLIPWRRPEDDTTPEAKNPNLAFLGYDNSGRAQYAPKRMGMDFSDPSGVMRSILPPETESSPKVPLRREEQASPIRPKPEPSPRISPVLPKPKELEQSKVAVPGMETPVNTAPSDSPFSLNRPFSDSGPIGVEGQAANPILGNYQPPVLRGPQQPTAPIEPEQPINEPAREPASSGWDANWLQGIVPGLVSAITGTSGGFHIGGKALVDRQKMIDDFNNKLRLQQIQDANEAAKSSGGGWQSFTYRDSFGQARTGWMNKNTLERRMDENADPYAASASSGFGDAAQVEAAKNVERMKFEEATGKNQTVYESEDGTKMLLTKGSSPKLQRVEPSPSRYSKGQRSIIQQARKEAKELDPYVEDTNILATTIADLSKPNNSFAQKQAIMAKVKALEGRLSDQDRAFYLYPLAVMDRLKTLIGLHKDGQPVPESVMSEIAESLRALDKAQRLNLNKMFDRVYNTGNFGGDSPLDISKEEMRQLVGGPILSETARIRDRKTNKIFEIPSNQLADRVVQDNVEFLDWVN